MTQMYVHGKLIDGVSDCAIDDALVVLEEKKVLYAGAYHESVENRYPNALRHVVTGKTMMPGLIDAHVHLTLYGKPSSIMDILMDSETFTAIKASECAKKLLYAGFTTVRAMGDKSSADIAVKRAVNEGLIVGPRILSSGKAISITGGHGDFVPGNVQLDSIGETCDGENEVRKAVRNRLKNNCDNIKLMATGGGNSPGPGTVSQLTVAEMRAAVEEAETRNALTAAHAIGADGIKRAIAAGVRTIEHGSFLDDEGIEMLLKGKHYLVPTLCAFRTIKHGSDAGVPGYVLEKIKYFATEHYNGLKKAFEAGVNIVCGTDTGTPFNYHGEGAEELRMYTEIGMSPMQAIKTATSVAAKALRQDDIGVLKEGMTADMLIVEGDPSKDVAILMNKQAICTVIHDGIEISSRG